jgi:ABC-type branched-subunit amino acid transport system ATPase component/ABC-type branched-subunit amino acid transport system permease subunit
VNGRQFFAALGLVVLLVWPEVPGVPADALNTAILAALYLVTTLSLVLLIGYLGQISLGQASLVGMGAFASALATHQLGVRFPFSLGVGLAAGAGFAALIGVVALRVRGLYLAVATLIFAYVCDQYLFVQPWLVGSQSGTQIAAEHVGTKGSLPYFDLSDPHIFYYVALAVAVACVYGLANLRESRAGRAFSAIRGSEVAAASLGINVMRYKLLGFAAAGGLAGLAGALTLSARQTVQPSDFDVRTSLFYLSIAVVGGLQSLGGAVAAALFFALLVGEVFFRFPRVADFLELVSASLLFIVLLFFKGGMGALPTRLHQIAHRVNPLLRPVTARMSSVMVRRSRRQAKPMAAPDAPISVAPARSGLRGLLGRLRAPQRRAAPLDVVGLAARVRAPSSPADILDLPKDARADAREARRRLTVGATGSAVSGSPGADGRREPSLLSADSITVRFGGLTAVNDASLRVGAGEIVGLIGPNGAGKTTLFNAILGLNQPTAGRVSLYGRDVTGWPVHKRAALGVGRTFQIIQLFGDQTVFDNLMVATHLQNPTTFWGGLLVTGRARSAERAARQRVRAALELLELEPFADRRVAGLPFGVLRLVEVARTLVTGARLVCFDEPASGLDSRETEELIEWFRLLRELGLTLLVIEHDVSMVTRLCDHIYVLDQGRLIASGPPQDIQRDPAVIASYLGNMEAEAS